MDLDLYHSINDYAYDHHWFEVVFKFFATRGEPLLLAFLVLLWLPLGRWQVPEGRRGVVAAGFSAVLALLANQVISHVYERTRPFVHHAHHLFIARSTDPSFPSDHATGGFAIAVALLLRNRVAGLVALLVAILMSVGRVAVGTHYPSDVLAGAAIGTAAALILFLPPPRRALDTLADFASRLYERIVAAILRQSAIGPSSGARP
jgi:undecaprenyl-diphosphatase